MFRSSVNVFHERNLLSSFVEIILVDAQSVDPDFSHSVCLTKSKESAIEVLRNGNELIVATGIQGVV